jgi:hypothetical protein
MNYKYSFKHLFTLIGFAAFCGFSSAQVTTYPYTETFGNSGCGLPAGYTNGGTDPWDFQNTSETYMQGLDHTSNGGCFASMDDSGGASDDSCILVTPTFNLTSVPGAELRFWWQNSNGTTSQPSTNALGLRWSGLQVDISTDNGATWTRNVWSVSDSEQVGWAEGIVDLSSFISTQVRVRFTGYETRSFYSDMSLDDILIFEPQQWDAELMAILSPTSAACGDTSAMVEIEVINNGFDTINELPVSYQLGSGMIVTDTIPGSILPNATQTFMFSTALQYDSAGVLSLKAWTDLPLDSAFVNDTLISQLVVPPTISSYPYYEDFEGGVAGWQMKGSPSTWDFGTPAKSVINGAASGSNAFVNGGLTGDYVVNEDSWIESPCFDLTSIENEMWVALDIWYDAEFSWDGAVLQISNDSGSTWQNIGAVNDPFNWYTDNSINGNPGGQQEGWSGTGTSGSGGYLLAKHMLPDSLKMENNIIFRIAFGSDGSVVDDGVAIDNFAIVDYKGIDLGQDAFSLCGQGEATLEAGVTSWGSIMWSTGDSINNSITVSTQGKYWVEFTDTILEFTTSDTVDIIVSNPPQIAFAAPSDTILENGQTVLDPNLPFDLTYQWTPGNFNFPYLLVKGSDLGLGSHTFELLVTDSVACTDQESITVVVIDVTGLDELSESDFNLFPNPVEDILNIQFNGELNDRVLLELYNGNGQLIRQENLGNINNSQITFDLSDQKAGMYMLNIQVEDQSKMFQVIKK